MRDIYSLSKFDYDILLAPHHCSKYSIFNKLSDDSCKLSETALESLSTKLNLELK